MEKKVIAVVAAVVMDAGRVVELELAELIEARVFQLNMPKLVAATGHALQESAIYYTLNKRLE